MNKHYAVFEKLDTGEFVQVSNGFVHSTSCYAKLGRMVNADVWAALQNKN